MLAQVQVTGQSGTFAETPQGFIHAAHLRPLGDRLDDQVAVARLFLGTPYLWGGNGPAGIDCSGLVQAARRACGLPCPADSDLQRAMPSRDVAPGDECPGDLICWKGHVALVSEPGAIIHANAHHMAVAEEPLPRAEARIAAKGDPVLRRLRPDG
jgi:cell wall-associated NlpC family hydrolase